MGQTKVTVVPDENGNNIRQSKNPEYGFVRIVQEAASFGGRNGWANTSNRSALIKGKMEALEQLGLAKAKKLDGKIIILESTTAFNPKDPDRDLKIAGSTGIICCTADGEPIFRTTYYDPTGSDVDELVAHANGDAIREANNQGAEAIVKEEFTSDVEEEVEEEEEDFDM
tara:strand:+ start:868 stop:1377 length:510 start_codon:yes stop_codon:yes gene_type:complete